MNETISNLLRILVFNKIFIIYACNFNSLAMSPKIDKGVKGRGEKVRLCLH